MNSKLTTMNSSKLFVMAAITSCVALVLSATAAEKKPAAPPVSPAKETAAETPPNGKAFDTPQAAADALVQAATSSDMAAAKEILGPDSDDIINSEDPVADKNRATEFANRAKEKKS